MLKIIFPVAAILIAPLAVSAQSAGLTVTQAEYQSLCLGMSSDEVFEAIDVVDWWTPRGTGAVDHTVADDASEFIWRGASGSDMVFATFIDDHLAKVTHSRLPAATECGPDSPPAPVTPDPIQEAATSFGNGSYEVGVDIAPGLYQSTGPIPEETFCTFYRMRVAGGSLDFDNVIDEQFLEGPGLANILPSDGGFVSDGCQPWTRRR